MGAWLAIVSGALKLANYIAAGLQQHHDELNGKRQLALENAQASLKGDQDAMQARQEIDNLSAKQLADELCGGSKSSG